MIIFRIFLYLVCILSISWSALVFGGPAIIKRLAFFYSDGALELTNVSISPNLDINIGRLDFDINENGTSKISGISRASKIGWSLRDEEPFITLDFGPTALRENLTLKNILIHTPPLKDLNWQDLVLAVNLSVMDMKAVGKISEISIKGNLDSNWKKFNSLNLNAKNINLDNIKPALSATQITGDLDEFDLYVPVDSQSLKGRFVITDLFGTIPAFKVADARGSFNLTDSIKTISMELLKARFSEFSGSVDEVRIYGEYDRDFLLQNLSFDLFNGTLGAHAPQFTDISAEITKTENNYYNALVAGNLREFEMYNLDAYVGLLPRSEFIIDLEIDNKYSEIKGISELSFNGSDLASINTAAKLAVSMDKSENILHCATVDCKISDFNFTYEIALDDEWVRGISDCPSKPCDISTMQHLVTTSNTANVFSTLNRTRILSPLSSFYLYNAISAGQEVNNGHRLKF